MAKINKTTPLWLAFALAFCSGRFYREVVAWRWRSLLHLLLFIALAWIPVVVLQSFRFDDQLINIANQLPVITIKNQQATIEGKNKTYYIRDPNSEYLLLLIDMKAKGNEQTFNQTNALAILNSKGIYFHYNGIHFLPFTMNENGVWTPEKVQNTIKKTLPSWLFVGYLILVVTTFIMAFLVSMIYALIGCSIAYASRKKLTYLSALSLSWVAITPSIAFYLILLLFNITFVFEREVLLLIGLVYLIGAVHSLSKGDRYAG